MLSRGLLLKTINRVLGGGGGKLKVVHSQLKPNCWLLSILKIADVHSALKDNDGHICGFSV